MKAFGIDLDGVIWLGAEALPGVSEAVTALRRLGPVYFLTNNSAKTRKSLQAKLKSCHIDAPEETILTSAYSAIQYCQQQGFKRILVLAPDEMKAEYQKRDFELSTEPGVEAVVVHYMREFNYDVLAQAVNAVLQGAVLIGCNRERIFPIEEGKYLPGAGPLVAAVEAATLKEAVICGKPEARFMGDLFGQLHLDASEFVMIGDSVESDVLLGRNVGCKTVLIRSSTADLTRVEGISADFECDSLLEFSKIALTQKN